jgi:DNA mismatch repair protein MutL
MASKIVVLDESVANKIAAGEVVERPASVVKELVENAIDAGATRVRVDIEEGGKRLIRVTDDGCGMSPEDAALALQRHATSKIREPDDLFAIRTLGFRGEALPSIASVSQFTMTTREAGADEGTRVVVEGGEMTEYGTVGCAPGTVIEVRNLFFNTPARYKFMRSTNAERGQVSDVVAKFAMAHPQIAFQLYHDGHQLFATAPGTGLLDVIAAVYGRLATRSLLPVDRESAALRIWGYTSNLELARMSRAEQTFFVNRRHVRSKVLTHALNEPYQTLLTSGRHPVAVIHVELDPHLVDPNVHPTKIEVRFTRDWEVHNLLRDAVHGALAGANLVRGFEPAKRRLAGPSGPGGARHFLRQEPQSDTSLFRQELHRRAGLLPGQESRLEPLADAGHVRVIGQTQRTFILVDADEQLLVVDQHAAHERVLYDRLVAQRQQRGVEAQALLIPLTLELSPGEFGAATEARERLREVGFELEEFGGTTLLVRAVPLLVAERNYEAILRALIERLAEPGGQYARLEDGRDALLATMACKAAVKAGDELAHEEMERLIEELRATDTRFTCPHGRPTVLSLTVSELHRRFERT